MPPELRVTVGGRITPRQLTAGGKLQLATITHTGRLMRHAEREEASQGIYCPHGPLSDAAESHSPVDASTVSSRRGMPCSDMTWVAWRHDQRRTAAAGRFLQARATHRRGPWRAEGQEVKRPTQDQPPRRESLARRNPARVERFRESIRAAEQRRTARQDSPTAAPPAYTEEHLADSDTTLQVHLAACVQAAQNQDWGLLKDSARQ